MILLQSVQDMIDDKIATLGTDAVAIDAWLKVRGLMTHIAAVKTSLSGSTHDAALTSSEMAVEYLVQSFVRFSVHYFERFCMLLDADLGAGAGIDIKRQRQYWRHQAVEGLCQIWQRINPLVSAVKDPRVNLIENLVRAANPNKQLLEDQWMLQRQKAIVDQHVKAPSPELIEEPPMGGAILTVPSYATQFELINFNFAPSVFLIGMPIYSLETPWNWHVVWHEMAGHLLRSLETDRRLDNFMTSDTLISNPETWAKWKKNYRHPPLYQKLAAAQTVEFVEDGEVVSKTLTELQWETIDQRGWISECLEDAYGILSLGLPMLRTLQRILGDYYVDEDGIRDGRHPTPRFRVHMGGALLLNQGVTELQLRASGFEERDIVNIKALTGLATGLRAQIAKYIGAAPSAEDAEKMKIKLLAGEVTQQPDVSTLVVAATLAFEEQPSQAPQIAQTALTSIQTIVLPPPTQLEPLSDTFFQTLVNVPTWQELLSMQNVNVDRLVTIDGHIHTPEVVDANGRVTGGWGTAQFRSNNLDHYLIHRNPK